MNEKTSTQPGRYRHDKGNEYTIIGMARHSNLPKELVQILIRAADVCIERITYGSRITKTPTANRPSV